MQKPAIFPPMSPDWFPKLTPFREAFRQAIKRRGLTQLEFADKIGISRSFLANVIAGNCPPPLKVIETWIQALDLEPQEAEWLHDLAVLACTHDRVLHMFDQKSLAWKAIQAAQHRIALENSVVHDPRESVDYLKEQLAASQQAQQAAEAQAQDLRLRLAQVQALLSRLSDVAAPPAAGPVPPPKKVP